MKVLVILTVLTFVNGFQIRNVDEEADITISKANNSISFNKMAGVLHDNIKIVYMKFDFDFNVVLKEVDDIKLEYKRENETIPLYASTYDEMVDLANKIEESEKKLPERFVKEGTYINMDRTVMYESEEVIEISQKKFEEIGRDWYGKAERINVFDKMIKIWGCLNDYNDIVNHMLLYRNIGHLYFSKPDEIIDKSVVNIATAINQIEENHENYEINWGKSEPIMFKKISQRRYEILQKIILTSPDNTYELWSRDTFPLVYQNVLIDIKKTSGNYIAFHEEKQEFGLVSSDFLNIFGDYLREVDENGFVTFKEDLKKCVQKNFDFLCQRTIETYPISKLSENCEGAILLGNGPKIREFCDWKLVEPRFKSKTVGSDIILFNPEPIAATMVCNEKIVKKWNKDEFQLQGLQRLSIPTFCSLKTSQYEINGGPSWFKDGIQLYFNDTGLETIWPELSPKYDLLTVLDAFSTQMIHMESLCWIGFVALFVHTVLS